MIFGTAAGAFRAEPALKAVLDSFCERLVGLELEEKDVLWFPLLLEGGRVGYIGENGSTLEGADKVQPDHGGDQHNIDSGKPEEKTGTGDKDDDPAEPEDRLNTDIPSAGGSAGEPTQGQTESSNNDAPSDSDHEPPAQPPSPETPFSSKTPIQSSDPADPITLRRSNRERPPPRLFPESYHETPVSSKHKSVSKKKADQQLSKKSQTIFLSSEEKARLRKSIKENSDTDGGYHQLLLNAGPVKFQEPRPVQCTLVVEITRQPRRVTPPVPLTANPRDIETKRAPEPLRWTAWSVKENKMIDYSVNVSIAAVMSFPLHNDLELMQLQ